MIEPSSNQYLEDFIGGYSVFAVVVVKKPLGAALGMSKSRGWSTARLSSSSDPRGPAIPGNGKGDNYMDQDDYIVKSVCYRDTLVLITVPVL